MAAPLSPLLFGIPRRSGDGRLWTRYPQGNAPNSGGTAQGLGASVTASASSGGASGGGEGPTYYVDRATGTGGSGTIGSPWSMRHAIDVQQPGDHFLVMPGEYLDPDSDWNYAFAGGADGTEEAPIIWESLSPREAIFVGRNRGTSGSPNICPGICPQGNSDITYKNFTVQGVAKIRGVDQGGGTFSGDRIVFDGFDVIGGGQEGTDNSLNWGAVMMNSQFSVIRNTRVAQMADLPGSDNSGAIEVFNCRDCIIEYCDADGTNVYSTFGTKAGNCHRNIWRFNIARAGSIAFYMKSNTEESQDCDDQQFYGNLILAHANYAFKGNARQNRSKIFNNTAIGCPRFYSMWKLNSTLIELFNNIFVGSSDAWLYEVEELGGASPDFSPYIAKANYNCLRNLRSAPITWGFSGSTMSLVSWISGQTNVEGHDVNSITSDPALNSSDFYQPNIGSPVIGAGEGGVDMGWTGAPGATRVGTDWAA